MDAIFFHLITSLAHFALEFSPSPRFFISISLSAADCYQNTAHMKKKRQQKAFDSVRKADKNVEEIYYRSIYMNETSAISVTLQKAAEKIDFNKKSLE